MLQWILSIEGVSVYDTDTTTTLVCYIQVFLFWNYYSVLEPWNWWEIEEQTLSLKTLNWVWELKIVEVPR